MPLLDLKTDLKSLKYGQDRPGGGNSNQPYIQTDINTVDTGFNRFRMTKFDDGLVRGGFVGAANASVVDAIRIGKFLKDFPKGPLFITKQVGLQLSNPKLEVKSGVTGFFQSQPTRIYNLGINTLAQVPVNAFGIHFNRHGLLPVQDDQTKYLAVVQSNNQGYGKNNRLVKLLGELQLESFLLPTVSKSKPVGTERESNSTVGLPGDTKDSIFYYKNKKTGELVPSTKLDFNGKNRGEYGSLYEDAGTQDSKLLDEVLVKESNKKIYRLTKGENNKGLLKIAPGQNIPSLSYFGGPNSTYNIGFTNIKRYSLTNYKLDPNKNNINDIAKAATQNLTRLYEIQAAASIFSGTPTDPGKSVLYADLGVSLKDTRLGTYITDTSEESSTARDKTAVSYGTPIPSLRDYKKLITAINKIPKRNSNPDLYNIIEINNLHDQNVISNTLSSNRQLTSRDVSSTGFSTKPLAKITYFNGIKTDGKDETVVVKTDGSWSTVSRENRVGSGRKDSINLTPIFSAPAGTHIDSVEIPGVKGTNPDGSFNINDLAKFRIQALNGDNPDQAQWMIFRAYITQFTDTTDATWNPIKYAGRGEDFYVYSGFTRKISINFKVAALSAEEMEPMYQKLNFLMGNAMPDYDGNGLMRGPLVRMTVGNWIDGQAGILTSVGYTIPNESPWEIAINEPLKDATGADKKVLVLPHIVEVQLSFTPIGSQTKGVNKISAKSTTTSHIAQNINDYNYIK